MTTPTTQATTATKVLDFSILKNAVAAQFEKMKGLQLYRTNASKDWLWQTYIDSFPAGTNPIYKERTEHDCNTCRSFIGRVGNVVAIEDGQLVSVWDVNLGDSPYQVVADALSEMVKANVITNVFLTTERVAGADKTFQQLIDDSGKPTGGQTAWNHFFVNVPTQYVVGTDDIGGRLSDIRATHDVMLRGLTELTAVAVDTVAEWIAQNSLYRGEESKFAVTEFQKLKRAFDKLTTDHDRDLFVWAKMIGLSPAVAKIRGTAIGTLLIDLSEGMDIELAVKKFETSIMAPTNYKRPTALITPKMVEQAQATVQELGLVSALSRRYAVMTDITLNNILFADRSARTAITGDVFDQLAASLPDKPQTYNKVEEVPIEKFLTDVLPTAKTVEIMFENRHVPNLFSLIAPVDPTAGRLLKWDNNFSWAYNGEVADAIKERVKAAGGNVSGDLCCRLAWNNTDDLDFHMIEPDGHEIYYRNKGMLSRSGGMLDVDMNAGHVVRDPVENIFYTDRNRMKEGTYKLFVHQFSKRETENVGFQVQFDFLGTTHNFVYDKPLRQGENVTVVEFRYSRANGVEIINSLPSTQTSKTVWGLQTQTFHKVSLIMLSPNHWDRQGVGNRHFFFVIDGCVNDAPARGLFNEMLRPELEPHRKTFEVLGAKLKAPESPNQLSGIGISSTQKVEVLCRVTGAFTRVIKLV